VSSYFEVFVGEMTINVSNDHSRLQQISCDICQSTVELISRHHDCLSQGSQHVKCNEVSFLVFSFSAGTRNLLCALTNKNLG